MQVILLADVEKLGLRGDVVQVARGYARNFLLPRRLAEAATPGRVADVRRQEAERARQEARSLEHGQQIAEVLSKTVLRFDVKAGPTGALFGSVTASDIADEIWRARRVRVDRRKIALAEPIRRVGRYDVPVEVFADVTVEVKTLVAPEGGELPEVEEPSPASEGEAAEPDEQIAGEAVDAAGAEQLPGEELERT